MYKRMSNRLFEKLPKERYVVLATIPQDYMEWGDAECFAFDDAAVDFEQVRRDCELYETYEEIYDLNEYVKHNPKEEPRNFKGVRLLIALKPNPDLVSAVPEMVALLKRASELLSRSKRIIEGQSHIPHLIEGSLESLYWEIDDLMIKYGFSKYKFISAKPASND